MTKLDKVLLVEDNPHDAELTIDALMEHEFSRLIELAKDGEEALDYLFSGGKYFATIRTKPDLIILDLKLPKIGGLEVLGRIKSDPALKQIPVVIFSSSREEQDVNESYDMGVNAYVVKPVNFDEFNNALTNLSRFWSQVNEFPTHGGGVN
jgi:CheY-like chemotaxis protein